MELSRKALLLFYVMGTIAAFLLIPLHIKSYGLSYWLCIPSLPIQLLCYGIGFWVERILKKEEA